MLLMINPILQNSCNIKKSSGEHEKFQNLCNRVKYYKESQKGVDEMCQLVEEYAKEKFKEPEIPRKVIEELNDQLKNTI